MERTKDRAQEKGQVTRQGTEHRAGQRTELRAR